MLPARGQGEEMKLYLPCLLSLAYFLITTRVKCLVEKLSFLALLRAFIVSFSYILPTGAEPLALLKSEKCLACYASFLACLSGL